MQSLLSLKLTNEFKFMCHICQSHWTFFVGFHLFFFSKISFVYLLSSYFEKKSCAFLDLLVGHYQKTVFFDWHSILFVNTCMLWLMTIRHSECTVKWLFHFSRKKKFEKFVHFKWRTVMLSMTNVRDEINIILIFQVFLQKPRISLVRIWTVFDEIFDCKYFA